MGKLSQKEKENALNEVRILASIHHPNIAGYKEAFFEENIHTLNIVMEFADDGDLESKIQKNVKSRLLCIRHARGAAAFSRYPPVY
jgi:NIMA (never in mitosis gene a)-related kinase